MLYIYIKTNIAREDILYIYIYKYVYIHTRFIKRKMSVEEAIYKKTNTAKKERECIWFSLIGCPSQ